MSKNKLLLLILMVLSISVFNACSSDKNKATNAADPAATVTEAASEDDGGKSEETTSNIYGLSENISDGAILHAWAWSFNTIKDSMQDIAIAGYSAVQTSPINACYQDASGGMQLFGEGKWYYHYQPTDWTIGNYQLGTKDEFSAMCEEAHKYGIKVIVDVAPNHTATDTSSVSQNFIDAVGGIDLLYHKNGKNNISNWGDRMECTTGSVGGVPDVDTENPAFQDYFITYLNECIACGADGFRYDTAKHIGLPDDPNETTDDTNNFWPRVLTEITNADTIFNYGEVLQGDNDRIEDYISTIGATTASSYGAKLRNSFAGGNLSVNSISSYQVGNADPDHTVTWVESHDNYINDETGTLIDDTDITLIWAFITARKDGTPLFYDRPYGAGADNKWGTLNRIGAAGSPLYKSAAVSAVNHFRNAMIGEDENLINPGNDTSIVMVERGTKGCVIINAGDAKTLSTQTSLSDGTYQDRADSRKTFTVKDGILTGDLAAQSVAVLYNEGYIELPAAAAVNMDFDSNMISGDNITVTLHAANAKSSSYSIDGAAETAYNDGDTITLGDGLDTGKTVSVKLSAVSSDDAVTCMTYIFTKKTAISSGLKVYFEKPDSWSDAVNVYVYDESTATVKTIKEWPGVPMTKEADGRYSFTFEEVWDNCQIIFNDGKNQYPAAMEPGFTPEDQKTYTVQ
jgi:alpha-amylase